MTGMRVATVFGVHLRVNALFLLVLALLVSFDRLSEAVTLFGTVLLHEIAHVISALRHGLTVREIELLPFGGVARIEALLEVDPWVEQSVAIVGPLTNLVLAGVGWLLASYNLLPHGPAQYFMLVNLTLGGFNMLPALPLDGGRIYRARLARLLGYREATERATRLSKHITVGMLVLGSAGMAIGLFSMTLVMLAMFILLSAGKEQSMSMYVFMRYLTQKHAELEKAGWMEVEHLVAQPEASVKVIVRRFVPKRYHIVWIVDHMGEILGVITEKHIIETLFESGIDTPLGALLRPAPEGVIVRSDGDN